MDGREKTGRLEEINSSNLPILVTGLFEDKWLFEDNHLSQRRNIIRL